MGIINNVKCHYRGTLLKRLINYVDESNDYNSKLTLLDAVIILNQALERVEPATVRNCFKKEGFKPLSLKLKMKSPNVQPFLSGRLCQ
ncbi:tigger transposable element-derived protein 4 [Plakobranchus ocellatus]|uniref:Tigger transposable element-derived protein 4 n=1 Tax=Plakobranchus ocellatus TaxID=259542 RepID=A0AAV4E1B4_9GAST|nr:tigger transposable element-derived protein 4 [Plakobranchus ocellatus]